VLLTGLSNDEKTALNQKIKDLNGTTRVGDSFDSTITHVIAPTDKRTLSSLAATLAGVWLLTPLWITESHDAGIFLPEGRFGTRSQCRVFEDSNVFFSEEFKKENGGKGAVCSSFVLLGKGRVVDTVEEADYVLAGKADPKYPRKLSLSISQFYDMIQKKIK